MSPSISYRIWFTPRTGSTLLCKGLELTGVAGRPGEFFNVSEPDTLFSLHGVDHYDQWREHLWRIGSTPNGVFGIKHSMYKWGYEPRLRFLADARALDYPAPNRHEAFWADLFPNVKHIYLTRRNKVRQAASWWQAIQTERWHLGPGERLDGLTEAFWEERYDLAALTHLLKEAVLRECAIENYFAAHGIVPLTLVYEDLTRDYAGHLRKILDYLGVQSDRLVDLDNSHYRRTANAGTERWVQHFRADLQVGWEKMAW